MYFFNKIVLFIYIHSNMFDGYSLGKDKLRQNITQLKLLLLINLKIILLLKLIQLEMIKVLTFYI